MENRIHMEISKHEIGILCVANKIHVLFMFIDFCRRARTQNFPFPLKVNEYENRALGYLNLFQSTYFRSDGGRNFKMFSPLYFVIERTGFEIESMIKCLLLQLSIKSDRFGSTELT